MVHSSGNSRSSGGGQPSASSDVDDDPNQLVTPASLALSLSPPRAPPHSTPHRSLLTGFDPSAARFVPSHDDDDGDDPDHPHSYYARHDLRSRLSALLPNPTRRKHKSHRFLLPHPHLPAGPELGDRITRALGSTLSLPYQNSIRDGGKFRSIVDGLVTVSVPTLALSNFAAVKEWLDLTNNVMEELRYGNHPMQRVELFLPQRQRQRRQQRQQGQHTQPQNHQQLHRGLVFFVHGGAWGSGLPWMYRLVASSFLPLGLAVAIVGYRTYPDADAAGQVEDLERAADELWRLRPELFRRPPPLSVDSRQNERACSWLGVSLMGHSSGAHIALLMLVDRVRRRMHRALSELSGGSFASSPSSQQSLRHRAQSGGTDDGGGSSSSSSDHGDGFDFDSYVGLSGPYSISHHFDYEAGRGVEELSPMKPACGHTREAFDRNSPALRLASVLADCYAVQQRAARTGSDSGAGGECDAMALDNYLPPCLLVHGVEDSTVPFTATAECAAVLRRCGMSRCGEAYLGDGTGHQDTVMELMLGGPTRNVVVEWLEKDAGGEGGADANRDAEPRSRLIKRSNL